MKVVRRKNRSLRDVSPHQQKRNFSRIPEKNPDCKNRFHFGKADVSAATPALEQVPGRVLPEGCRIHQNPGFDHRKRRILYSSLKEKNVPACIHLPEENRNCRNRENFFWNMEKYSLPELRPLPVDISRNLLVEPILSGIVLNVPFRRDSGMRRFPLRNTPDSISEKLEPESFPEERIAEKPFPFLFPENETPQKYFQGGLLYEYNYSFDVERVSER